MVIFESEYNIYSVCWVMCMGAGITVCFYHAGFHYDIPTHSALSIISIIIHHLLFL